MPPMNMPLGGRPASEGHRGMDPIGFLPGYRSWWAAFGASRDRHLPDPTPPGPSELRTKPPPADLVAAQRELYLSVPKCWLSSRRGATEVWQPDRLRCFIAPAARLLGYRAAGAGFCRRIFTARFTATSLPASRPPHGAGAEPQAAGHATSSISVAPFRCIRTVPWCCSMCGRCLVEMRQWTVTRESWYCFERISPWAPR